MFVSNDASEWISGRLTWRWRRSRAFSRHKPTVRACTYSQWAEFGARLAHEELRNSQNLL